MPVTPARATRSTTVVVIDVPGTSGPNRIARLWHLSQSGQSVKQTATVQGGIGRTTARPDVRVSHVAIDGCWFASDDYPGGRCAARGGW